MSNAKASGAAAPAGRLAGRPVVVDRQRFIDAALGMLAEGRNLAEVSVADLCIRARAGKGSFYSPGHFREGKLPELHREVIAVWLRESAAASEVLRATLGTVRDPLERLRMIRAAGGTDAVRADAMRRWAVTSDTAAAAVADAAGPVLAHISAALSDLGFPAADAGALARLLAPVLGPADDAAVDVLLRTLDRAARDLRSGDEVAAAPGRGPGETVLFMLPRDTPTEIRRQVEEQAQGWLVSLVPGEPADVQLAQATQPGEGSELPASSRRRAHSRPGRPGRAGDERPPVDIRVLTGSLEVTGDDDLAVPVARRERALLSMLLVRPGQARSRELLARGLWPGRPPARPAGALRVAVSRARKAVGDARVATLDGGYRAEAGPGELDLGRYLALREEGAAAAGQGNAGEAAAAMAAALGCWGTAPFADLPDEPETAADAARLLALRQEDQFALADMQLALGRHQAIVPGLLARTVADPVQERTWEQLVLALIRCGRRGEALDAYARARAALIAAHGSGPGPVLAALMRAALDGEHPDWPPGPRPAAR